MNQFLPIVIDGGDAEFICRLLAGFATSIANGDDLDATIERLREYAGGGVFDDDVSLMRLRLG